MKSALDLSRVAALSITLLLGACGQKGPLYLPAKQPQVTAPAPQTPPVPADTTAPASR